MTTYKFQTVERDSVFTRLDFRSKILIMIVVTLLAFLWEDPIYEAVLAVLVLGACLAAGVKRGYITLLLAGMSPFYLFMLLTHAFFNVAQAERLLAVSNLHPIFTLPADLWLIGGLEATWEGFLYGANVMFKTMSLTLVIPLAIFTTDVDEMISSMVHARVPYKLAFIFSSTFRFSPLLWSEFNKIVAAQRLRGMALESMGLMKRVRVYARVVVPLILSALVRSQQLEVVLQSKAFNGDADRTYFHEVQMEIVDYFLISILFLFSIAAIYLRVQFGWGKFSVWF
ncbi:MAG: energy-coupling factor transporter transmembrane protein EcfT [Anaerolineaceae bacterium]|nr:energy-coupling factor transporter transmembrane protein EcfT [Anaerolineaceae bacterium]